MKQMIIKPVSIVRYFIAIMLISAVSSCKKPEHLGFSPTKSASSYITATTTITSISPNSGIEGITHTITIAGTNFSSNPNDIRMEAIKAGNRFVIHPIITHALSTSLTAEVYFPLGCGGYRYLVTLVPKKAIVASPAKFFPFYITTERPLITGCEPLSAMKGEPLPTSVVITGVNFSNVVSENKVTIGGIKATFTKATNTSLTVSLPANISAKVNKIDVTTSKGTSSPSNYQFRLIDPPSITSAETSEYAFSSSTIKIKGEGFDVPSVIVCGIKAEIIARNWNLSELTVKVPNNDHQTIKNGDIIVQAHGKEAKFSNFTIYPKYNKHDLDQVIAFFKQNSSSFDPKSHTNGNIFDNEKQANGEKISYIKPETWIDKAGFFFDESSSYAKNLVTVDLGSDRRHYSYSGTLDLKKCPNLAKVRIRNTDITALDLTGASADLFLVCATNKLTSIKLSHALKDNSNINPQKAGTPDVIVTTQP